MIKMKGLFFSALLLLIQGSVLWSEVVVENSTSANSIRISKGSFFDTFEAGGWVMWPILLCSLVCLAYGFERLLGLREQKVLPSALKVTYDESMAALRSGKMKPREAIQKLTTGGGAEGEKLFDRFMKREFTNIRDLEQVLQEYVEVFQWSLQKNIKPLSLVIQVSPLLGLFGTVLGMIQAFNVVAEQGLGKPELLANGMAVALLTTGFGLGVAIPCSLFHHYLIEKSSQISLQLYNMLHELALELCGHKDSVK
jgi:biopolymer transport protein ExbB